MQQDKGLDFAGATWVKSTRSGPNCDNCVEVAIVKDGVGVRDSKNPNGPVLSFTVDEWNAFREGVALGEFDL